MSTVFVIVLKKYPKDHEHASTETTSAKLISILLNKLFEKPDKTLLFIRNDIEKHQAKDYKEIANFLTNDHCHDFFEESPRFRHVKREYCKSDYLDIICHERQDHAKRIKDEQQTWDYQEKTKHEELNSEILKRTNKLKSEEENTKKETLIWIDNKQRTMKGFLRKMYNNLFSWRGVWRNKQLFDSDPENVPVKLFNFVTKSLSKPILKNVMTQGLCYYDEEDTQRIIKRKNVQYKTDNWRLLNCNEVFEDEIYCELANRLFSKKMTREDIEYLKRDYVNYLEEFSIGKDGVKETVLWDYKCTVITPLYAKNGRVQLTKNSLVFYDNLAAIDEDLGESQNDHLDFFTYKKKAHKLLYTVYDITKVRYIFKRRFLFDKQCIEIIFENCSTITINFGKMDDFTKFCKHLVTINNDFKHFFTPFKKTKITEEWKNGKISNYMYMMFVNYYGSRSFNDLSQYPVIPWFLDYKLYEASKIDEEELETRDFELNLLMIGSETRLEKLVEKYYENEDFEVDRYFMGSHYSNPGVILQYLVRVPPFLDGLIKFQSGKLDCPDRMYSSMISSYTLALTENGDFRELIPETITLPEMFTNNYKVNFGMTQENVIVDAVRLPPWANDDPYYFTTKMKEYFEHDKVSEGINQWIDLIFGFKQKGEEAIEVRNLYPAITYEDGLDMNDPENQENKHSLIVQLYNFGQCPTQLFTDPH